LQFGEKKKGDRIKGIDPIDNGRTRGELLGEGSLAQKHSPGYKKGKKDQKDTTKKGRKSHDFCRNKQNGKLVGKTIEPGRSRRGILFPRKKKDHMLAGALKREPSEETVERRAGA